MNTRKFTTCSLLRRLSAGAAALVVSMSLVPWASAQSTNYPATILSNNPVAYYQLQELPGATVAVDSTTNGLNANYVYDTDNLTPELGFPGIDTNSIAFLGPLPSGDGSIDIPFSPLLAPVGSDGVHGGPFSIECWAECFTANLGGPYLSLLGMFGTYGAAPYGNASGWLLGTTPGTSGAKSQWLFNQRNVGFIQGTAVTPLQWTYLVGTFDGTNQNFYVNGVLAGSATGSGYLADNGSDGAIGGVANAGFPPYGPWYGFVDQIAFYTNVLTTAQISNDYAVGLSAFSDRPFAPIILTQPSDETNYSGTEITFSVVAIGSAPQFQWSRQGVGPIPGATNGDYTFVTQYPNDNGAVFTVTISNSLGTAASESASLTVETNIVVEGPPFSITRNVGGYAAFRIGATGALPISYQWSISTNGGTTFSTLPGQTGSSLWLSNIQVSLSGNQYAVVATNPFGSYSNSATLTVVPRTENVPLTGYAAIVAADSPVAYWQLNEQTNATVAVDAVGSFDGTYDSTNGGAIVFGITGGIPGDTNTAVDLHDPQILTAGLGGRVDVPYALELNSFGTWSMEAWVRPDSVDGVFRVPISSMANVDSGNLVNGWLIYEYGSIPSYWTMVLFTGGASGYFGTDFGPTFPLAGVWNHLAITDDGTTITFYVNGAVGSSFPASVYVPQGINGDPSVAGENEEIGQRSDNAFFGGNAGTEDVAIYDYALSPAQIASHYTNKAKLSLAQSNGQLTLSWGAGTLMSTSDLTQPFTAVVGATSPYVIPTGGSQAFYVVVVP